MQEFIKVLSEHWQTLITILGVFGIAVDVTPIIKIQPIRWLLKKLGNLLNSEIIEEYNDLNNKVDTLNTKVNKLTDDNIKSKINSKRSEILNFANSCMNNREHTKEEFDHIIDVYNEYTEIITENHIKNDKINFTYKYITDLYEQNMRNNSFLMNDKIDDHTDYLNN